ncbi:hypothetical protein VNO78_18973 [Psophocarpus tetragonolobus]|uniref:Uncharacterized protein n=1 Tax=Psophocarpus tetragonolobus TaxID=3891 RepID=A0AAN9S7P3_PSOTE
MRLGDDVVFNVVGGHFSPCESERDNDHSGTAVVRWWCGSWEAMWCGGGVTVGHSVVFNVAGYVFSPCESERDDGSGGWAMAG